MNKIVLHLKVATIDFFYPTPLATLNYSRLMTYEDLSWLLKK